MHVYHIHKFHLYTVICDFNYSLTTQIYFRLKYRSELYTKIH